MQYNHIFNLKKVRNAPLVSTMVKASIFLFAVIYIAYTILNKNDFDSDFKKAVWELYDEFGYWICIPLILFPLNWAIEAIKWQYLSARIEKISFFKSFRGIFTGVTLGFVTPLGLGDYAGRILQLNSAERARSIGAVFISRISQFYITLVCGSASLIYLGMQNLDEKYKKYFNLILIVVFLVNIIFALLFFMHKKILHFLQQWNLFRKLYPYIEIISQYEKKELAYIIFLSLIRYLVFTCQFVMILYFFNISKDTMLLTLGVNFIFLIKSVIPTFFDLGVRESAAVFFFSNFMIAGDKIIFASLSVWAINILIPALLGMFLIFRLKIFTKS